jgi:NTE family protein
VDGGLVNPVPYDLLFDECEVVIAIDVLGNRTPFSDKEPGYFENTFNTFQIMQASIMREKIKYRPPHIYIHPDLNNIGVLDFHRFEEIYDQAMPARNKLKRALRYNQILG